MDHSRRAVAFIVATLVARATGCYSPEVETPSRDGDDQTSACVELDEPCAKNGDCCDFDTPLAIGTALCVSDGTAATCTDVCSSSADCGTGCCGALDGENGYGACMQASVCDAGYEFSSAGDCLHGVDVFCACGDQLDVPCVADDRTSFEAACSDGPDEVVSVFVCFAGYDPETDCGAALNACG